MGEHREQVCRHCGKLIQTKTTWINGEQTVVWIHSSYTPIFVMVECPGAEP